MSNKYYTTQLQAGLGAIQETRSLLGLWEMGMKPTDLFNRSLESGHFPNVSARRLRNLVTECFAPRFMGKDDYPVKVLKDLISTLHGSEFEQLLFLFTARANRVLYDFIKEVYWSRYSAGQDSISNEEARFFVTEANQQGKTKSSWSENSIERVAGYLTLCCADFGMLESGRRKVRKILPFRIQSRFIVYLTHELHFDGLGDNAIIAHPDWQLYGLQPEDVRDELKQLARKGFFIIQSAGDITRIGWKCKNWEDLIDVFAKG